MILINGTNSETYGITFLQGCAEELLNLPPMKAPVTNQSRLIDGVQMDARNAKLDTRNVTLDIRLKGTNQTDYLTKYENMLAMLRSGKNNTGITEISYLRYIFRLRFEKSETLRILADNMGRFSLTFTEPNPANRQ